MALTAATVVLTLLALYYLWKAALTDPGIIPAQPTYLKADPPAEPHTG